MESPPNRGWGVRDIRSPQAVPKDAKSSLARHYRALRQKVTINAKVDFLRREPLIFEPHYTIHANLCKTICLCVIVSGLVFALACSVYVSTRHINTPQLYLEQFMPMYGNHSLWNTLYNISYCFKCLLLTYFIVISTFEIFFFFTTYILYNK